MGASMLVDLGTYYVQLVYRVAGQIHLLIMCRRIWYGTGGGGIIGWHGIGWWKHMGWASPLKRAHHSCVPLSRRKPTAELLGMPTIRMITILIIGTYQRSSRIFMI